MNTYSWIVPIVLFSIMAFIFVITFWQSYYPFRQWRSQKKQQFWKYWESISNLETIYIRLASIVGVALLILFFALYFQVILIPFGLSNLDDFEIRNLAFAFLGTVTGLGGLFGVYMAILRTKTTERQTHTAEEGLITDRINKAVEGLGKSNQKDEPVVEIRLGALYALERIAQDSIRDHMQIIEILCAYIRTNSPNNNKTKRLREDIRAALTIIGRREGWTEGKERLKIEKKQEYHLDLSNCDLQGVNARDANFSGADFNYSNLTGTQFFQANMSRTIYMGADLSRVSFNSADMSSARLFRAIIHKTSFNGAKMHNTNMHDATILGVAIETGSLLECLNITQEHLNQMFCGFSVDIPEGLTRPTHWPEKHLDYQVFRKKSLEWQATLPSSPTPITKNLQPYY